MEPLSHIHFSKAEKKEEGNKGASTKKRASAAQLRITKVQNVLFLKNYARNIPENTPYINLWIEIQSKYFPGLEWAGASEDMQDGVPWCGRLAQLQAHHLPWWGSSHWGFQLVLVFLRKYFKINVLAGLLQERSIYILFQNRTGISSRTT